MKVYPDPLNFDDLEGFSSGKDLFRRRDFASGMSKIVSSVQDPLVIAFDGEWGSGKTTFLKMWAGELRRAGHPVILLDAFENDYVDDAFSVLAREVFELIDKNTPSDKRIGDAFKKTAANVGALLIQSSAKIGARLLVRSITAGILSAEDFGRAAEHVSDAADEAVTKYIENLISDSQKQKSIIAEFRSSLEKIPYLIQNKSNRTQGDKQLPLIFIVDELDRCKPPFALSILERIKHFMSVPNVHFVLGVNMDQLENSVRYAYGSSIDANAYLQRFINFTIFNFSDLESSPHFDLLRHARYLIKTLSIGDENDPMLTSAVRVIVRVLQFENQSFRSLERVFTILSFGIGYVNRVKPEVGEVIGGLAVMKLVRPSLFKKAKSGTLNIDDVRNFLRFIPADEYTDTSIEEKWWIYFLCDQLPKELETFLTHIPDEIKNFGNRRMIVQHIANHVIDRSTS